MIRNFLRLGALLAAFLIWLIPGSSIAAALTGGYWLWRNRRRRAVDLARWRSFTREQQSDKVLPADWRARTLNSTFPTRLMCAFVALVPLVSGCALSPKQGWGLLIFAH